MKRRLKRRKEEEEMRMKRLMRERPNQKQDQQAEVQLHRPGEQDRLVEREQDHNPIIHRHRVVNSNLHQVTSKVNRGSRDNNLLHQIIRHLQTILHPVTNNVSKDKLLHLHHHPEVTNKISSRINRDNKISKDNRDKLHPPLHQGITKEEETS